LNLKRLILTGKESAGSKRDFLTVRMDLNLAFHCVSGLVIPRGYALFAGIRSCYRLEGEYSIRIASSRDGDGLLRRREHGKPLL
jgi:hypothetical protein